MAEKMKQQPVLTLLLIVGAVYFLLQYVIPLIAPIFAGMLFVTMCGPFLKKMQERFRIHRQVGTVVLLLLALGIMGILLWILFSWIAGSLPKLTGLLDLWEGRLSVRVERICEGVGRAIGMDSTYLEERLLAQLEQGVDYLQEETFPGMVSLSYAYLKKTLAAGAFLVTFLIAAVLLAKDYDRIMNGLLEREDCHVLLEVICGLIRYLATFVKAQLLIMGAIGTLSAVVLGFTGIPNGVLWGILAGFLDVLPFVGTGVVLVPLALGQFLGGSVGTGVICLVLYGGCAFLRELLEPRLIGRQIGIPALAVLVSVYGGVRLFGFWGILKGPLGMIIILQVYRSLRKRGEETKQGGGEMGGAESV